MFDRARICLPIADNFHKNNRKNIFDLGEELCRAHGMCHQWQARRATRVQHLPKAILNDNQKSQQPKRQEKVNTIW